VARANVRGMDSSSEPRRRWAGEGADGVAPRMEAALSRLEQIRNRRAEIRRLEALQVRDVAAFIGQRDSLDADLGVSGAPSAYRSMVAEVALSMGVSVLSAQSFMSDAHSLVDRHPAVLRAVQTGELALSAARAVAVETSSIDEGVSDLLCK
jgi:hypothetical protein